MEIKKPAPVDFEKLVNQCYQIISETEILIKSIIKSINFKVQDREDAIQKKDRALENELTKEISELKLALIEAETALEIEKKTMGEYKERCTDYQELKQKEYNEFLANYDTVFGIARNFETNEKLPDRLRDHLRGILNLDTSRFDRDQKVAFYLALKKEVEMCNNYLKNSGLK